MSKDFYEICKSVVGKLELTKEQGIARDVILNMLDMKEKESKDYLTRINKVMELLDNHDQDTGTIYYKYNNRFVISKLKERIREVLGGDVDE